MTESLRALLAGAIDYAGMFPPAGLPPEQALAKYRQHRHGPEGRMVGRFVYPAEKLGKIGRVYSPESDGNLAVVVPWGRWGDEKIYDEALPVALTEVGVFPFAGAIDTLEFRWLGQVPSVSAAELASSIQSGPIDHARTSLPDPVTMFFEMPPIESSFPDGEWLEITGTCVRQLGSYCRGTMSTDWQAGFKLRCAGAGAVPTSQTVASVICECRREGVFWKATAGLHHPFRHFDPELGVPVHGFINLLTAAVMADIHRLEAERVRAILEDDDPWHFRFSGEALTWNDLSATVPQIAGARERSLRSFGSCSIDEPWQDLMVLGLL